MSNVITGSTSAFGGDALWQENKVDDIPNLTIADLPQRAIALYANEIDKQFKLINSMSNGVLALNALSVSGAVYLGNNLILSASGGHITSSFGTFLNDVFITGSAAIGGDLRVTGSIFMGGDLDVDGNLTASNILVENDITVTGQVLGDLDVTGNITGTNGRFTGDLTVVDQVNAAGLTSSAGLNVSLNASIGTDLDVGGNITGTNGRFTGDLTVVGDISSTGNITGSNTRTTGDALVLGEVTAGGLTSSVGLNVTGDGVFGGTATAAGLTSSAGLDVTGPAVVTGDLTASNGRITTDLTVVGNVTASNARVTGDLTLVGSALGGLRVSGTTDLEGDVNVTGSSPTVTIGDQAVNSTGSLVTQEITGTVGVTGKIFDTKMHSFVLANADQVYAPWTTSGTAQTAITDLEVAGMAVGNGELREVILRSNTTPSTMSISFHTDEGAAIETIAVDIDTADTPFVYVFSASSYTKGAKLHLGISGTVTAPDEIHMVSRWLNDYTS